MKISLQWSFQALSDSTYADDIMLIAPSVGGLNELLKLCDNYATVYNVM